MRRLVATLPGLLLALAMLAAGTATRAEEQRLNGLRIHETLAGNTVIGTWSGQPYRSYFRPDGLTVYKPDNGPAENGKWRVDEENDQYCSWWARSGWSCYNLYRDGRNIIWEIPGTGERFPSQIVGGKQF